MAAASPSEQLQGPGGKKPLGLMANAMKNKSSFIQLFFMTGVLLLSMRSLSQKYRIHDLQEDTSSLREENEYLSLRMDSIKKNLLQEASNEPTGHFAARLHRLFGESSSSDN